MGEIITAVKLAVEMNWAGFTKERWIRFVCNLEKEVRTIRKHHAFPWLYVHSPDSRSSQSSRLNFSQVPRLYL